MTHTVVEATLKWPSDFKRPRSTNQEKFFVTTKGFGSLNFLKSKKVDLVKVKLNKNGEFDLKKVMSILYQNNIRFLLVEGGNKFTNEMLDKNLFNEFYFIILSISTDLEDLEMISDGSKSSKHIWII